MTERNFLLTQLHQAFDHKSWHGTNLSGSLRGLKPKTAAWRPSPVRHNIWEYIVHCAYWKYAVIRIIKDLPKGSFALTGSNFFTKPDGDNSLKALHTDIELLKDYHKMLLDTVSKMSERQFLIKPDDSAFTNRDRIIGVAAHDIYHAGQIQLLKRMQKE